MGLKLGLRVEEQRTTGVKTMTKVKIVQGGRELPSYGPRLIFYFSMTKTKTKIKTKTKTKTNCARGERITEL